MAGSVDRAENASGEAGLEARQRLEAETKGEVNINEKAVSEISEEAEAEEVVKKQKETSDYFNTITTNEPEHKLIKAIVDEDIQVTDGSRVRLRLLDDIDVGDRTITKGSYLYCTMSGFSQQRIKGTVKSVLVNDELVKVNLSIYDTDGMEGLYVPKSSFRETTQDVASGAMSQSMSLNDGSSTTSMGRWGMQALQNAYQKTANAISKNIRKNKVKVKYGTRVYLINSKEKRKEQR
jgi:conjugative transposon TraM protein